MLRLDIDPKPTIQYLDITTHRLVASNFMGEYASIFKGRGIAFESYREYSASNDDAGMIDWKASTRASKLLVKEYTEERNLDVFFLIDASHTMVFGSQKKLKHEYAAEMVAACSFAILDRGDSVGMGLFTDSVNGFLMPDHGLVQYRRILHELANPAHYDGSCDFETAVRTCLHRLRPQTLLVLVTDAVGLSGEWEHPLKVANTKFDTIALIVRDPRDDNLPEGVGHVVIEDAYTGEQILIDSDRIREQYAKVAKELKDQNISVLRRARITDVEVIPTNEDFARHIVAFFERRKRRYH
jgi:uncharacterized protein (DUF58 family)